MQLTSKLAVVFVTINLVLCLEDGAPPSSCIDLIPNHGMNPQNTPSPYATVVSKNSLKAGESLTIELVSLDQLATFQGFLILAQIKGDDTFTGLGKFSDNSDGKIFSCLDQTENAFTHNNIIRRTYVNVTWTPPPTFSGTVVFRTTFAKDLVRYWVAETSEEITIEGGPSVTTETPTTPTFFYENCGKTKGCFGYPANCVSSKSCSRFFAYRKKSETTFELELAGIRKESNTYVAAGFSKDNRMGDDVVVDCAIYNDALETHSSFNKGHHNNRLNTNQAVPVETKVIDGYIYCKVEFPAAVIVENISFNLLEPHYILMAAGPAEIDRLREHTVDTATTNAIDLTKPEIIGAVAGKGIIVKLHGAFMAVAWMFAASLGIICARYFKKSFPGKQLFGKDLWFVCHVGFLMTTWILTIVAFIMIFVDVGGWADVPLDENPHALFGCLTMAFAFVQPIMANFRPAPSHPKRYMFNWAHFLVGNFAHVFGLVCIFLAVFLEEAALPEWSLWVLVAFLGVYILAHGIFSIFRSKINKPSDAENKTKGEEVVEKKLIQQRKLLLLYVIITLGLTIAVIVAVDQEEF